MVEYYEEAEEFLENISDDIPLFTNTREGIVSEGTRTAPAPLETHSAVASSDLFVSPLRQQLLDRMAHRKNCSMGGGGAAYIPRQLSPSLSPEMQPEVFDEIPTIANLQLDDDDEEDYGDIPIAPSRSRETSPPMQPKTSPGVPAADKSPLQDKMMTDLVFSNDNGDSRDVSPHVIQGLVQIMGDGPTDKKKKATIAMCNLCCESGQNRTYAGDAGAVSVLIAMMKNNDAHLQRLATACICNLSADPPLKDAIARGGAIPYLSKLLESTADSVDARAAAAHAAATLWSLCVDMDHIKPMVAQDSTLRALIKQLTAPESFVRGQACGCVGEVCIGNKAIKGKLSAFNVIPILIALLDENDPATQRLGASALCNLAANHDENKQKCREAGLIQALIKLLKTTSDDAVQSAAAGGLYNLVTAADRKMLEDSQVVEIMRRVPISRNINVRLGIKSDNVMLLLSVCLNQQHK